MKKIFLALGVATILVGAASCNKAASSNENQGLSDSLSTAFGQFFGQNVKMQAEQIKAQFGDKYDEAALVRGIQAAMKLDTADVSYMIGYSMGLNAMFQINQWAAQDVKVNPAAISKTVVESMNDTTIDPQAAYMNFQMINNRLQAKMQERAQAAAAAKGKENGEAAEKYIAEQKSADSAIQTSESGLSYKIENPGTDPKPDENATVSVIYTGRHINGEEFDSSKGEPVSFRVGGVVPGFAEGLQLLGKGGKATLYIPGNLAYGENGQPQAGIQPNEMLVFDVEIVDITPGN